MINYFSCLVTFHAYWVRRWLKKTGQVIEEENNYWKHLENLNFDYQNDILFLLKV